MGRKKILLITNIFPPEIGGPATFISTAARKLSEERGWAVTVLCAARTTDLAADLALPYRVVRVHRDSALRRHLAVRWALVRELWRHRVVLVNGFENVVHPIARRLRRGYVLKVPGDSVWQMARNSGALTLDIDQFQRDPAAQSAYATAVARRNAIAIDASHVITPSDYLKGMVAGWGVPRERITTIPNGVDLTRFGGSVCRRAPSEPLRVLFVGRLTNWKGVETALLAAARFAEVRLQIVGDGPEYPQLDALARQLDLGGRVEFLGRRRPEEVARIMAGSHALVLTSLYEGMSHTLQEAMAAGLVCVASDNGGNNEVIRHGENGLLVPAGDVAALAETWRRLHADEAARFDLAEKARAASRRYSMDATVEGFVKFFDRKIG